MSRIAAALGIIVLAAAGCVHTVSSTADATPDTMHDDVPLRPATNLPSQFAVTTPATTGSDCPPRLRDDGLGVALVLRRAVLRRAPDPAERGYRAYGDYATEPHGRYGEEPGDGLRVDCARLRGLGLIRLAP